MVKRTHKLNIQVGTKGQSYVLSTQDRNQSFLGTHKLTNKPTHKTKYGGRHTAQKLFLTKKNFDKRILYQKKCWPKKISLTKIVFQPNFFIPTTFGIKQCLLDQTFFGTNFFLIGKNFGTGIFVSKQTQIANNCVIQSKLC